VTKVKICGLRSEQDIACANRCLPDYVGFVFADSKRRINAETARGLKKQLDYRIQAVGVFVNQGIDLITRLCRQGVIDCVQLHGDEDETYIRALRESVSHRIIKAVGVADALPVLPVSPDYLLFDTASAQRGGTGKSFDWQVLEDHSGPPYFLAGGLDSHNVAQAVERLHPYCVDVSSGVETDGRKDPEKIDRFIKRARGML